MAGQDFTVQQFHRQGVLDQSLDRPFKRPGAEIRIVALARQQLSGGIFQYQRNIALAQHAAQPLELYVNDPGNLFARQSMKDHDIVDPIQKFRFEVLTQNFSNRFAYLRLVIADLLNFTRAQIGSHDQNSILEINRASLRISQAAIVENLQQHIEHVRMRLFDFIKENYRIWPAAHCFGKLPAFLVTDISRGSADHARDGVLLHVFGHVEPHHRAFVVKQKFGKRARRLGLADTGWTKKDK